MTELIVFFFPLSLVVRASLLLHSVYGRWFVHRFKLI